MGNPLSREDMQAIRDALEPLMIRHDYQRRDATWHRFNSELIRIFDFQAGTFRQKAYFNLAFVVRARDDSTRPEIHDCSVHGRLDLLVPDLEHYELATNFAEPGMTQDERVSYIVRMTETIVLPFHEVMDTVAELGKFLSSSQAKGFRIKESAKKVLREKME